MSQAQESVLDEVDVETEEVIETIKLTIKLPGLEDATIQVCDNVPHIHWYRFRPVVSPEE